MKFVLFGGFIIVAGSIMFSTGSIDWMGNTWLRWTISLRTIGILTMLFGFAIGMIGILKKDKTDNDKTPPTQ